MQIALLIGAGALFAAGVALGIVSGVALATATFGAAIFCLIFAFLARFKRFKGLGIEAELWEQKQEEAAHLVDSLRALATVAAERLVNLSARAGRWDSATTRQELFELTERLDVILRKVDVSDNERTRMKADFYRITAIDMALPLCNKINKAIETKADEQRQALECFGSPVTDLAGYNSASERLRAIYNQKIDWNKLLVLAPKSAMYEALKKSIDQADCLTQQDRDELQREIADEIEDLREWVTHKRLRRPEVWFSE